MAALFVFATGLGAQFRSRSDAVVVPVSVLNHGRPVADLGASDFEIFDNDVRQQIVAVDHERAPLDVTMATETSRQVVPFQALLKDCQAAIRSLLPSDARVRLMAFDADVREGTEGCRSSICGDHGAVLFDAVAAAAMQPVRPGHRPVVVVLTAGRNRNSVLTYETLRRVLATSDAVVYILALGSVDRTVMTVRRIRPGEGDGVISSSQIGDYDQILTELAELSGGRFLRLAPDGAVVATLRRLLAEAKGSYVIRYQPSGTDVRGWHTIRVIAKGADVHSRRGYWQP